MPPPRASPTAYAMPLLSPRLNRSPRMSRRPGLSLSQPLVLRCALHPLDTSLLPLTTPYRPPPGTTPTRPSHNLTHHTPHPSPPYQPVPPLTLPDPPHTTPLHTLPGVQTEHSGAQGVREGGVIDSGLRAIDSGAQSGLRIAAVSVQHHSDWHEHCTSLSTATAALTRLQPLSHECNCTSAWYNCLRLT